MNNTNPPEDCTNEFDFILQFEQAFLESPDLDLNAWVNGWHDESSQIAVAISLIHCGCELRQYDYHWLQEQISRLQIDLPDPACKVLLRNLCGDQIDKGLCPSWEEFERFGYPAADLKLAAPVDRCYLGQILDNRYQLCRRIASGALGTVYQAAALKTNHQVAVKISRALDEVGGDDYFAKRLLDEAEVVQSLSCEGVPRFVEMLETIVGPALVVQLIEGESLQKRLGTEGLPVEEALSVISQIARIVDHLHQTAYVHGDLKAENVLVSDDNSVTVIDFNVSRTDTPDNALEGFPGGTLPFMSPEAIVGVGADVDLRQDIYALGALLYQTVTGKELLEASSREEAVVKSILIGGVHEPQFPENMPQTVKQICQCAISRQPVSRFETAKDFATACEAYLADPDVCLSLPIVNPRLTAWRLGRSLGLIVVRQRRLTSAFSIDMNLSPEDNLPRQLLENIQYFMGVTTAKEELTDLARQLGIATASWQGDTNYSSYFYKQSTLKGSDLPSMQETIQEAETWCQETLSSYQDELTEKHPISCSLFLAGMQSRFVPYSQEAAERWLECAAILPVPEHVTSRFAAICSGDSQVKDCLKEVDQLDYEMVRFLRWE